MQDARSKIRYLRRRIDALTAALRRFDDERERLTRGGAELLDWSLGQLEQLDFELFRRLDRAALNADQRREDAQKRLCNDFAVVIEQFADFALPALNGARSDRVPVEMESALQRYADRAEPAAPVRVVLYGADTMGYSVDYPKISPADRVSPSEAAQRKGFGPDARARFVSLRIPAVERDSGTMHSLALGHELGHLRVRAHDLTKRISKRPPEEWRVPDAPGMVELEFVGDYELYCTLIDRWSEEILSDIIAVRVLGPAALLAFGEMVGAVGTWDKEGDWHPGSDRRCALMLRVLLRNEFAKDETLAGAMQYYKHLCNDAISRHVHMRMSGRPETANSPRQLAWDSIISQLDHIVETAIASVSADETFDDYQFSLALAGQAVLAAGRPFAQYSARPDSQVEAPGGQVGRSDLVPVDPPAIFNAAWLVRINMLGSLGARVGTDVDLDAGYSRVCGVLDELVLKSIEISEHLREHQ